MIPPLLGGLLPEKFALEMETDRENVNFGVCNYIFTKTKIVSVGITSGQRINPELKRRWQGSESKQYCQTVRQASPHLPLLS